MGTQQTADLAIGTTAAEAAIIAATQAAVAAGKDPFGDDDDDNSATVALLADGADADGAEGADDADADADQGDEPGTESDAADADLTAEQLEAVAADASEASAAPELPRFKAQSPAEFAQVRKDLLEKRAKAFKEYADGIIEPDEYSRIDSEVYDALEALTVQRTLHEANAQSEVSTKNQVLDAIMVAAKAQGVDYTTDAQAAKRFDAEMALLEGDGVQRTYAEAANLAHRNVLAVRGIKAPTPAAEPAKPRANGKPPLTLRDAPSAAVPNTGGGWQDQLDKLSGQDYEDAFSRLTPAQQAQLRGD
jgi:hypothetical protein